MVDALMVAMIDDRFNFREYQQIVGAVVAGDTTGGRSHPSFKRLDGAHTVVVGDVDADGNRTVTANTPGG
jgi:hypothetical protein